MCAVCKYTRQIWEDVRSRFEGTAIAARAEIIDKACYVQLNVIYLARYRTD